MIQTIENRLRNRLKVVVVMLLFAFPLGLNAQQTPQEWLETIDRNLNPPQYESYRKLINI